MTYTLKRAHRKTISIQIGDTLTVIVRAPLYMPRAAIDQFVCKNAAWIERAKEKRLAQMLLHPEPSEARLVELKERAREYIPKRVNHYAKLMGLYPTGIKITSAKTRHGSCSAKNSLCFSCRLMEYPEEAIDYIVVHELSHIVHKNHGREFYNLIARYMPDWHARRALLRD